MWELASPLTPEQQRLRSDALQLCTGQAFIRLPNDTVRRVRTPTLPHVSVTAGQLHALRQHYLATYFRPLPPSHQTRPQPIAPAPLSGAPAPTQATGTDAVEAEPSQTQPEQPISRQRPDEPDGQRPHPGPVVWQQPGPGRRR